MQITMKLEVVSKRKHSTTRTENEAPKSRKRSTQNSKMEHERLETTVRWRTTTLSLAWRKPNQVEAMDASTPPKVHQSIPWSIWFLACRGRAVLIFIGWALLSCHPFVCVRQAGIIPTFSAFTIECLFVCVKGLKWPRIVVLSSVHESAKVWTFGHVYF